MRVALLVQGIGYLILVALLYGALQEKHLHKTDTRENPSTMNTFFIDSPALHEGQHIPSRYTCDGDNISPPLAFEQIPPNTVTMILLLEDHDVPQETWYHWVLYNIPKNTSRLGEAVRGIGTEGVTSWNRTGYTGPCPPDGLHHYTFHVFALDSTLRFQHVATVQEILEAAKGHIIAEYTLSVSYERV